MEADLFDPNELQSKLQRTLCETLLGCGQEVADSLASAYLAGSSPPTMRFEYHRSMYFNAFAQSQRSRHVIGINIAAVVLLQVLFQRLLSSADIVPELPAPDQAIRGWEAPFVTDVGAGTIDASVPIRLDDDRFFVAFHPSRLLLFVRAAA